MNSFRVNENSDDFDFWIEGKINSGNENFSFVVFINPRVSQDIGMLFGQLRSNLQKERSLDDTEKMINKMLDHDNEDIRELGEIVRIAADKAWIEYILSKVDDES